MPKKRLNKTLQTKPSSGAPAALGASTIAASKHGESAVTPKSAPSSVNELINHLRHTQISDEQPHRYPRAPRAATVHPSLRGMLSLPHIPPPRPRFGNNTIRPSGPTRMRRIPGPPPPASWLAPSSDGNKSEDCTVLTNIRVEQSSSLPGGSFPPEGSLQHTVLKAVALNLHFLEFDSIHLLPTQVKQNILSYVAAYQEELELELELELNYHEAINPFQLLFPKPRAYSALPDLSINDNSEVSRLDLGGAVGRWLSTKEFKELVYLPRVNAPREEPEVLPDSWDDEREPFNAVVGLNGGSETEADTAAEAATGYGARASGRDGLTAASGHSLTEMVGQEVASGAASGRPKSLETMFFRFSNLAHLSLALSPATSPFCKRTAASWSDLLKVAPSLSRLLSLSLAYWPLPTLTPHAASTYTTIKNPVSGSLPGVPYGGSDIYTSYDGVWKEAAYLLKTLSRHLYCLQWLDLTGCGDWFAALSAANGAEWTGAWRGMQHVGLCVGWQPESVVATNEPCYHSERSSTTSSFPVADTSEVRRFNYVLTNRGLDRRPDDEDQEMGGAKKMYYHKKSVEKYTEIRNTSDSVAKFIHSTRKGLGKWIQFDLSPELSAVKED